MPCPAVGISGLFRLEVIQSLRHDDARCGFDFVGETDAVAGIDDEVEQVVAAFGGGGNPGRHVVLAAFGEVKVGEARAQRGQPGEACVRAHSGRQIDRFFTANREEAEHYLQDIFWERRAIAARYAPVSELAALCKDPDEVVRRVVVSRLPPEALVDFVRDPDREVRLGISLRLPEEFLPKLINDPDYLVRVSVARRLPQGKLAKVAQDPEREVRKVVAGRLPPFALSILADDPEPEVRTIVAGRALPELAARFLADPEWLVRLAAVGNAPVESLPPLLEDPETEVREAAQARLAEQTPAQPSKEAS